MSSHEQTRQFGRLNLSITVIWLCMVIGGTILLWRYDTQAVKVKSLIGSWPSDSSIELAMGKPTGLLFIHPHCPCTFASLSELRRMIGVCDGMAEFVVVAFDKEETKSSWRTSRLVRSIDNTHGIEIVWDKLGQEARKFNVRTSGRFLLFNAQGNLVFSGGITGSRGHEGENAATIHIKRWLRNETSQPGHDDRLVTTPVFGCLIQKSEETEKSD